ncbi:MAG: thioredoxin family protein [Calditrichaeota bacterium]|nr:MAG: thioredoxin family protein [Calditrichota bacterium]
MKSTLSLLLAAGLLAISSGVQSATPDAKIDKPAPNFTLPDTHHKTHSLADYRGKFVVLEWVNFGCPFVRKHYNSGNMQKLQKMYTQKGVVWLSICSSAPGKQGYFKPEKINQMLKEKGASPTAYLLDPEGIVGKKYGAKTTPHIFVINPKGILIYAGGIDDKPTTKLKDIKTAHNYLVAALDAAMAGKPVPVKTARPYGCSVKYK